MIASETAFVARLPGSKSFTNRALLLAAQRLGHTKIENALHSDDTDHLAACLGAFGGLTVTKTGTGYDVQRTSSVLQAPQQPIYVAGAGTPARFLLAFASTAKGETVVTGNARLSERPMGDLLRAFDEMGVDYTCQKGPSVLPIVVRASQPRTRAWTVSGAVSSQFTSSLLLLAAQGRPGEEATLTVVGHRVSQSYVNMTIQMMRDLGIEVAAAGNVYHIKAGAPKNDVIRIEPDASAMSYLLGAAAVTGSAVTIPGIQPTSAQGDVGFAGLLERMGCKVSFDSTGLHIIGSPTLSGIEADMEEMPDTALTLAAIAALAKGPTRITNIGNLRVKECDRIAAAAAELGRMGVEVEEGSDYLVIKPTGSVRPAHIETYDDHRVAMAFSLIGLVREGITIQDPECVKKSFPGFWEEMDRFQRHQESKAA